MNCRTSCVLRYFTIVIDQDFQKLTMTSEQQKMDERIWQINISTLF